MARKRLKLTLEVIFWVGLLGFVGYRLWPQAAAAFGVGSAGTAAPAFEVHTIGGERLTLDELRGQVVLVNFWATWCGPCRVEMPGFQDVYEDLRDDGFTIVGISTDIGTPDLVRDFIRAEGITYPIASVTPEVRRAFGGVRALPKSFLIDRKGMIRHTVTGIFAEPALRKAVERLLEEGGTGAGETEE